MHRLRQQRFGPVQGVQLGYSPLGPPLMSVYVYRLDGLLIDTGQRHMQRDVLAAIGQAPIHHILLTHHHEDHSGNAAALARRTGATVWGHALCAAKLARGYRIRPYQHLIWGAAQAVHVRPVDESVACGPYVLTPVETPGHSKDHLVFHEANRGWLFSGDLFIGERIKFFRADEDLKAQIHSLKRVLALDFEALFCAHNPRPKNGKQHLAGKLDFLETLRAAVRDLHHRGYPAGEIIRRLDPGSDRWVRWLTLGNASFANMVRSALQSLA